MPQIATVTRRLLVLLLAVAWTLPAPARTGKPVGEAGIECYSRQNFGVTLEGARAVRSRGIDIDDKSRILELLAITAAPGKGAATIELVFAGGAGIRVECERIAVHGQDVGEPWPTLHRPRHPDIEAA